MCHLVAHAAGLHLAHFEGDAIVSIDLQNAFNMTRHRVIYDGLKVYFPGALKWYRWKYGNEYCPIRNNEGKVVAYTQTGVGQGDPWGSMLFEIAVQPSLLEAQRRLGLLEDEFDRNFPTDKVVRKGKICAFEDDTSATGETRVILEFAPILVEVFNDAGFIVNLAKSHITGKDVELWPAPEGFLIQREGLLALGVAIGSTQFVSSVTSING